MAAQQIDEFGNLLNERVESQEERKHFFVNLKENSRGRYIQVVEYSNKRKNCIVIPLDCAEEIATHILTALDHK